MGAVAEGSRIMTTLVAGDRARIVEFGPRDSWSRNIAEGDKTPLGMTGVVMEILENTLCSPGYITCKFHFDELFANYFAVMTLFEVKLERITNHETCKNTCV